jgi:hypothetical protein
MTWSGQIDTATLIDLAIFILLVVWMTLDRCNIYFRKGN